MNSRGLSGRRGRSGTAALSLFAQVKTIFAGGSVFDAGYYALDGASGKVAAFIDYLDPTHTLAQGTSANQVSAPAPDAAFNNEASVSFTATQYYTSSRAASAFRYLHDGTGCTMIAVCTVSDLSATRALLATRGTSAATGIRWGFVSTPAYSFVALNGATNVVTAQTGTPVVNTNYIYRASYVESGSPEYVLATGNSTITSGSSASAPAAGDPTATLRLGANTDAAQPHRGKLCALLLAPKVLSAGELATVHSYFLAKYAVAA